MEKNKKILLGGIIVVVVGAVLFCYSSGNQVYVGRAPLSNPGQVPMPSSQVLFIATSTPMSDWKTFVNTEYGYSVLVPQEANIRANGHVLDLQKSPELLFSAENGDFEIMADYLIIATAEDTLEKQKQLALLDLKSYAEYQRNITVKDKNPYLLMKVGVLKKIKFAGLEAYTFAIEGTWVNFGESAYFTKPFGVYVFTENLRGQKISIYHTTNSTSEKMVNSIRFIK
ncbi:MAG: hypothetical protein AAB552_01600 [Patescibacteria group bacterium]